VGASIFRGCSCADVKDVIGLGAFQGCFFFFLSVLCISMIMLAVHGGGFHILSLVRSLETGVGGVFLDIGRGIVDS